MNTEHNIKVIIKKTYNTTQLVFSPHVTVLSVIVKFCFCYLIFRERIKSIFVAKKNHTHS